MPTAYVPGGGRVRVGTHAFQYPQHLVRAVRRVPPARRRHQGRGRGAATTTRGRRRRRQGSKIGLGAAFEQHFPEGGRGGGAPRAPGGGLCVRLHGPQSVVPLPAGTQPAHVGGHQHQPPRVAVQRGGVPQEPLAGSRVRRGLGQIRLQHRQQLLLLFLPLGSGARPGGGGGSSTGPAYPPRPCPRPVCERVHGPHVGLRRRPARQQRLQHRRQTRQLGRGRQPRRGGRGVAGRAAAAGGGGGGGGVLFVHLCVAMWREKRTREGR